MVESFTMELSKQADKGDRGDDKGSLQCLLEVFAVPSAQTKSDAAKDKPVPIKDLPSVSLGADGNQLFMDYRGLHLPTWTAKNPDGTAAQPYVGADGKARVDGKLQPATDDKGVVQGTDGKPLYDDNGFRRYDAKGNLVATKFDASEPAQMQKAIDANGKSSLNDETRAAYNKAIESADKLDRVAMARTIENNEKYVMSHTTAFLWESRYQQLQKQGDEQALKAKEAELAQKPVLADQVKRVREGAASDEEMGKLLSSSVDTRLAYMSALLNQDSVKQYMSSRDKTLENDSNVKEARKVVSDLAKLNPALTDKLQPTARLLGLKDLTPKGQ